MKPVLIGAVSLFFRLLVLAVVVRAILSWVRPRGYNRLYAEAERFLEILTEPILAPIRRVLPPVGPGIDLSPLVAVILLDVAREVAILILLRLP